MVTIFGTVKRVEVEAYSQHLSPRHHGEQTWQSIDMLEHRREASVAANWPQNRSKIANFVYFRLSETCRWGMYQYMNSIP